MVLSTGIHTDGENIHEKGSGQHGDLNSGHRTLRRREKIIALGLYVHPIRDRQGQRSSEASQPKYVT